MSTLTTELVKISQVRAYIEQKAYENSVTTDYLAGSVSEELMSEVMDASDFELDRLISEGHLRSDLVRAAGL